MTTVNAERSASSGDTSAAGRALSPGTLGIAAATGLVLFEAVDALLGSHGLGATLEAGWSQLVAPAFVLLVLAAVACERCGRPNAGRSSPAATCRTRRTSSSTSWPSRRS